MGVPFYKGAVLYWGPEKGPFFGKLSLRGSLSPEAVESEDCSCEESWCAHALARHVRENASLYEPTLRHALMQNVDAMEHYVFCVPRCALHATQVSRMGPDAGKMDAPWR